MELHLLHVLPVHYSQWFTTAAPDPMLSTQDHCPLVLRHLFVWVQVVQQHASPNARIPDFVRSRFHTVAQDPAVSAEYGSEWKGAGMSGGSGSQREFVDILVEALEQQERAAQAVVPMPLWQPTTVEVAGVRHVSIHSVRQTSAARGVASRQQMATSRRHQEAVQFYYGRGMVVEQMWLA